jgi:uncharacterized protein YggE
MRTTILGVTLAAVLGAMSGGCAATGAARAPGQVVVVNPGETGILVDGHGEIAVPPDMATLSVGVEVTGKTVEEARSAGAEAASKVIASLKRNKVEAKNIQTERFSIQPRYEQDKDRVQRIVGYTLTNTVSAKIHDLPSVSRVVDDAASAGGDAVRINGVTFSIEDPSEVRTSARERAVADARRKAEQLAKLTGVSLASPIAVEEVSFHSPVVTLSRAAAAEAPTPFEPGENAVTLDVRVRWGIGQGA